MSTFIDAIVTFSDGTDTVTLEDVSGVQCQTFITYAEHHLNGVAYNEPHVINTQDALQQLSAIAAQLCPIRVTVDSNMTYAVESTDQTVIYQPMLFSSERRSLFEQTDDSQLKDLIYNRYVDLYNSGQAIFGAQLRNIDTITFTFN